VLLPGTAFALPKTRLLVDVGPGLALGRGLGGERCAPGREFGQFQIRDTNGY
jgi:hypothetical protein